MFLCRHISSILHGVLVHSGLSNSDNTLMNKIRRWFIYGSETRQELRDAWNEMQFGVLWRESSCKTFVCKKHLMTTIYDVIEIPFPIHEWWSELLQLLQDIFIVEYFKSNPHGLKKKNPGKRILIYASCCINFKFIKKKHTHIFGSSVAELSFGWPIFFATWQPKKRGM
jgi:hypothetical protein